MGTGTRYYVITAPDPALLRGRWTSGGSVLLTPCSDLDRIDFFVVPLDEIHNAFPVHQITSLAHRIVFRSKCARKSIPVHSWIKVMRGPGHADLI
jgi:hypothetical protein